MELTFGPPIRQCVKPIALRRQQQPTGSRYETCLAVFGLGMCIPCDLCIEIVIGHTAHYTQLALGHFSELRESMRAC